MFFICGVNSGQKELKFSQMAIRSQCGSYGRYQVFMTYMCLSLFFIPVLKWGRRYFVKMSCCDSIYELDASVGKRIAAGESLEIMPSELRLVQTGQRRDGQNGGRVRYRCPNCGYETDEDFAFCPKCGGRLS